MIITYFRSSSYNQHDMCEQAYYLTYVLSVPAPSGKAAAKGNIVHKALEVLAWESKTRAAGLTEYDDETFGPLHLSEISPEWAIRKSYDYYKGLEPFQKWNDRLDLRDCLSWMDMALTHSGGYFDPRNLDVLEPELRFDFTIDKPWAHYEYDTPEGPISGQLGLKGTIDLIVRDKHNDRAIEIIDWKTGQRRDWAIEDEEKSRKTYSKLGYDPQMLLYYYAAKHLFPDMDFIDFTIVYVRDGGPYRLVFGPEHIEYTERMIQEKFEKIKKVKRPHLNKGKKCYTFCWFGKNKHPNDETKTYCKYFEDEVKTKGIEKVTAEYGKNQYDEYGCGGGRRAEN